MKKIVALLLAIVVFSITSEAAFVNTYWGVRALGMGGAFTAIGDDADAPLYNIAGIANISQQEITLMGSRLFAGIEGIEIGANYLGYVRPIGEKYGSISFAWSSLSTPGLRREDTFNLGYARGINDIIRLDEGSVSLSVGVNVKYLMQEIKFDEDKDKDFSNTKGAFTADIGILAWFSNGIGIGYSNKYLVPADIGYLEKDEVKNVNVIGLSYYSEELPYIKIPYFTIAADVMFRDDETTIRAGLESWVFNKKLAIRIGGREEAYDVGFGYEFNFFILSKLAINYAFEMPLKVEESYGSHFFSLSFKFQ